MPASLPPLTLLYISLYISYILYNISPEIAANCFWEPILFLAPVQCCHCDSVQFLYSIYTHYINIYIYKYSNSQLISSLSLSLSYAVSLSLSLAVYIDCFCIKGSANKVQYTFVQDCQPVSVRVQLIRRYLSNAILVLENVPMTAPKSMQHFRFVLSCFVSFFRYT